MAVEIMSIDVMIGHFILWYLPYLFPQSQFHSVNIVAGNSHGPKERSALPQILLRNVNVALWLKEMFRRDLNFFFLFWCSREVEFLSFANVNLILTYYASITDWMEPKSYFLRNAHKSLTLHIMASVSRLIAQPHIASVFRVNHPVLLQSPRQ